MNLLNKPFKENGNYLCTWETQRPVADRYKIEGNGPTDRQRNAMCAKYIFCEDSLYHLVPQKWREGLFFLLDDGWDVPYNVDTTANTDMFGSLILNDERFSDFGQTPIEKLKNLSKKVKELGYSGLGLWICPQIPFENEETTIDDHKAYWTERAKWCNEAGIRYWKVDWGKHGFKRDYLNMMTDCVRENAPNLYIEHALAYLPFDVLNGSDDERAKTMGEIFEVSDFFRTYDVWEPFVDNITLSRLDGLLSNSDKSKFRTDVKGCINIESAPLIAVGLACNMGIMYGGGNVNAALSWQRLAPPMSIFDADYVKSEKYLKDYRFGDSKPINWSHFYGETLEVTAPAITARGTKLPEIEELEIPPFVMASCNNVTKAYAICTLHRVLDPNDKLIVPANITIFPEDVFAPIGIFGHYKSLTAEFNTDIPENVKVYAQCLVDDEAIDITDKVEINGNKLTVDGKLLRLWGRSKDVLGFEDDPALVLQFIAQ